MVFKNELQIILASCYNKFRWEVVMGRAIKLEILVANAIIEMEKETKQRFISYEQLKSYEKAIVSFLNSNKASSFLLNKTYNFKQLKECYPFFKTHQDNLKRSYLFLGKDKTINDLKTEFRLTLDSSLRVAFVDSDSIKALKTDGVKAFEIEKKYLLDQLPDDLKVIDKKEIRQTYLSFDPEMSIRKEDEEYFLIIKGEGSIKRSRQLKSLSREQFELYFNNRITNLIYKTRYYILIHEGFLTATIDVYHRQLEGLKVAEVEFDSIEMAHSFVPPKWFKEEVTYDVTFRNSCLADYCTQEQMLNFELETK